MPNFEFARMREVYVTDVAGDCTPHVTGRVKHSVADFGNESIACFTHHCNYVECLKKQLALDAAKIDDLTKQLAAASIAKPHGG
jgi:hypothetical protein